MEDILQTNPKIDAVFCAKTRRRWARSSRSRRGLQKQILLVGFDGALEATQKIIAGDMDATVAQAPYDMGRIGVQTAINELKEKRVKKSVNTGAKLVEPGNVKKYFAEVREKLGGTGRGGN